MPPQDPRKRIRCFCETNANAILVFSGVSYEMPIARRAAAHASSGCNVLGRARCASSRSGTRLCATCGAWAGLRSRTPLNVDEMLSACLSESHVAPISSFMMINAHISSTVIFVLQCRAAKALGISRPRLGGWRKARCNEEHRRHRKSSYHHKLGECLHILRVQLLMIRVSCRSNALLRECRSRVSLAW